MNTDKSAQTPHDDKEAVTVTPPDAAQAPPADQTLNGRSVFAVETTAGGIMVRTAFMTDDQRLLAMPAMFPNLNYALQQIDELRQLVSQHFATAAQVGAKVIAAQAQAQAQANNAAAESPAVAASHPASQ
jgi:hypothetical protein